MTGGVKNLEQKHKVTASDFVDNSLMFTKSNCTIYVLLTVQVKAVSGHTLGHTLRHSICDHTHGRQHNSDWCFPLPGTAFIWHSTLQPVMHSWIVLLDCSTPFNGSLSQAAPFERVNKFADLLSTLWLHMLQYFINFKQLCWVHWRKSVPTAVSGTPASIQLTLRIWSAVCMCQQQVLSRSQSAKCMLCNACSSVQS